MVSKTRIIALLLCCVCLLSACGTKKPIVESENTEQQSNTIVESEQTETESEPKPVQAVPESEPEPAQAEQKTENFEQKGTELPDEPESTDNNSIALYSNYTEVIQALMDDIGYNSQSDQLKSWHRGYFYDIDNDGQDELVIRYLNEIDGQLSHCCGVWDIQDGSVYTVLNEPFGIEEYSTVAWITIYSSENESRIELLNRYVENKSDYMIDEQRDSHYLLNDMSSTLIRDEYCKTYYLQDDSGEYVHIENPNKYIIDPSQSHYEIDDHVFENEGDYWEYRNSSLVSFAEAYSAFKYCLELSAYESATNGTVIDGKTLPELLTISANL